MLNESRIPSKHERAHKLRRAIKQYLLLQVCGEIRETEDISGNMLRKSTKPSYKTKYPSLMFVRGYQSLTMQCFYFLKTHTEREKERKIGKTYVIELMCEKTASSGKYVDLSFFVIHID